MDKGNHVGRLAEGEGCLSEGSEPGGKLVPAPPSGTARREAALKSWGQAR